MDKFEKVKSLEVKGFWVKHKPPGFIGDVPPGGIIAEFIDGSYEVFTKAECLDKNIKFKLRPSKDDA